MTEDFPIQVAVLAPTLAARVGLRTLLGASASIQIVAEVADPAELQDAWWEVDLVVVQGEESLEGLAPLFNSEAQLGLLWISDDIQAAQTLRGLSLSAWGLSSSEASSAAIPVVVRA